MSWSILEVKTTPERLTVILEDGGTKRTIYIGAGELAAIGHRGRPLYDGKPQTQEVSRG